MKDVLGLVFLLLCAVQIQGHSIITGDIGPNVTQLTTNNLDLKTVELFRQLLNQETIIRMGLEKNLQDLKKDVITIKQSMKTPKSVSQKTNQIIADLQRKVQQLTQENQILQFENITVKQSTETSESASQKSNLELAELRREVEKLKKESQKLDLHKSKYEETVNNFKKIYKNQQKALGI
jgi:chromosome segregation ATPase